MKDELRILTTTSPEDFRNARHTYLVGSYMADSDKTIIMEEVVLDGKLQSDEIVGWYYGEPRADLIKKYANRNLIAYTDELLHTPTEESVIHRDAREFKEYIEGIEAATADSGEDARTELYNETFVIGFKNKFTLLGFCATTYNAFISAMELIMSETDE